MCIKDYLYRIVGYLWHRLTAVHSKGAGIHSPYLFEWVRMVVQEKNSYYVWEAIEQIRHQLLQDNKVLDIVDYGSGARVKGELRKCRMCDVARSSLEPAKYAQLLFRLINWLGHEKHTTSGNGLYIMELGTSLGVTTAYLASANSNDRVVSFEGCPSVAAIARANWKKLGLNNVTSVEGNLDDTLFDFVRACEKVDVVFVDANHTYDATCRYITLLLQKLHSKSVLILDDIHYNLEMQRAWQWLCSLPEVTTTMDFYQVGIVFFNPYFLRKHYKLIL